MERLGRESGAFQTYIRTDSQWITKQAVPPPARNARNLDFFDAILFFGTGDNLTAQQKHDLISFIRDDGKGSWAPTQATTLFVIGQSSAS
jgi:uncharacterized protein